VQSNATLWYARVAQVACVAFGAYIAITSAVLGVLGVYADNGWLSIVYGSLGVSMGVAGIAAVFTKEPMRSALLGWFLIGITSRSVLDGLYFLWFIPFTATLLVVLVATLAYKASTAKTRSMLAGGLLAILSSAVLVVAAPHLPVICPSPPARFAISYPSSSVWEEAESRYQLSCLEGGAA